MTVVGGDFGVAHVAAVVQQGMHDLVRTRG